MHVTEAIELVGRHAGEFELPAEIELTEPELFPEAVTACIRAAGCYLDDAETLEDLREGFECFAFLWSEQRIGTRDLAEALHETMAEVIRAAQQELEAMDRRMFTPSMN